VRCDKNVNDPLYLDLDANGDKGLERKEMRVQKGHKSGQIPIIEEDSRGKEKGKTEQFGRLVAGPGD
jgi:hypothetical protein